MDAYQVWHRDGERLIKVADVEANDAMAALVKTQHGLIEARWCDVEGVTATPGDHRSTTFGDILLAPDGQELKLSKLTLPGFRGTWPGFEPTEEIREQGYADWLAEEALRRGLNGWEETEIARYMEQEWEACIDQEEPVLEPESTPEEQAALFASWRDDASQRTLMEKGVDYSDAPYGEPTESSYAAALKQAIARAKHQTPPENNAPQL